MLHARRARFLSGLRRLAIHAHRSRQPPADGLRARCRAAHRHVSVLSRRCDLKLQITTTLLHFRADHDRLLGEGSYRPLRVRGARATSVVAFERRRLSSRVVVVVPRLTDRSATSAVPLDAAFWGDTELRLPSSDGRWSNLLAGEELELNCGWCRVAELMAARPWVVLYHTRLKPGRSRSL